MSVKFTVRRKVCCANKLLYFVRRIGSSCTSLSVLTYTKSILFISSDSQVIPGLEPYWVFVVHDGHNVMTLLTSIVVDIIKAVVGIGGIDAVGLHQLVRHAADLQRRTTFAVNPNYCLVSPQFVITGVDKR